MKWNFSFIILETQNDRNWTQWDSVEARLRWKLFQNEYDPELRPVLNQSDQVTVTFGVSLHQIIVVVSKWFLFIHKLECFGGISITK